MPTIARVRAAWVGPSVVGGGVSTFYTSNLAPLAFTTALRTFFNSFVGAMPTTTIINVDSDGELIDEVSGAVNGVWTATPTSPVQGTGTGNYAAGVGCRIVWETAGVTRRRRVRGSTYLVPLLGNQYSVAGLLADSFVSNANTQLNTLLAADGGSMRVYTRPQTTTSNDGKAHVITAGHCERNTSWLRSRRT